MTTQVTDDGAFRRRQNGPRKTSGSIEQTLGALGIATDIDQEIAVQDAAEALAAEPLPMLERMKGNETKFVRRMTEGRARKLEQERAAAARVPPPPPPTSPTPPTPPQTKVEKIPEKRRGLLLAETRRPNSHHLLQVGRKLRRTTLTFCRRLVSRPQH